MHSKRLPRVVLMSFVMAFVCARIVVLLIMTRDIPDLYLHVGGTHVHHLNYGIVLLAIVGAVLLFRPPSGRWLDLLAGCYGVGLALTFDEFGMWLHLGGSYWQRASFDAITIVGGLLGLVAFAPPVRSWTPRRFAWAMVLMGLLCVFFWRLSFLLAQIEQRAIPELERIERGAPR